jgi:molybdopterin-guanine dinucleotide biosynthesis protein A
MPNLALATSSNEDITITPLLCVGGQSSRMGFPKHLLPFPDGLLAFEHALLTIHNAIPNADIIYMSLHDESQLEGIRFRLNASPSPSASSPPMPSGEDTPQDHHHPSPFPALELIFDNIEKYGDIGPAAALLSAHVIYPTATLLVLGCDYPLLPAAALQQLILEYEPPLTCFVNEKGFTEPLVAIWGPEALETLNREVGKGTTGLSRVAREVKGKLVRPLREGWIAGCNTREEWEEAMLVVRQRDG